MRNKLSSNFVVLFLLSICLVSHVHGAAESGDDAASKESKSTNHVYWLIKTSIKDGELENLKALNAEMVKATKTNEPGTLSYDWSISADRKTCYFFERYADSEAVMIHLKTFGVKFAERLMETIEIKSFQVFGEPDQEVKKALSEFGAEFHQSIGGFTK